MRVWTERRTAKDPVAYVARLNATYANTPISARLVSVDGTTPSGQKRYVIEITDRRDR